MSSYTYKTKILLGGSMKTIRYFVKQEFIFDVEDEEIETIDDAINYIDTHPDSYNLDHQTEVIQLEDENGKLIEEKEI